MPMKAIYHDRLLIALFALALILRCGTLFLSGISISNFGDSHDYLIAANALCQGDHYPDATELPFFRAPGLPLFLSIAALCYSSSIATLKFLLPLIDLLGMFCLIKATEHFNFSQSATRIAAMLYAISPMMIGQTLALQTEPLFQMTLIACTLGLVSGSIPAAILAGASFGIASLTRPAALGILPIAICYLTIHRKPTHLAVFILGASLLIAPWSMANKIRTGELILINDAFGYNFWRGSHPIMQRIYAAKTNQELEQLSSILEHELTPSMANSTIGMNYKQRSEFFEQAALKQLMVNPIQSIQLIKTKILVFLRPWLDPAAWGIPVLLITGIWESLLYLGGIIGWTLLWKRSRSVAALIALYLISALAVNLPFQVVVRFRIPFYEWVLVLLTAFAIDQVRDRFKRKNRCPSELLD